MDRQYITNLLADNYTDKWLWGGAKWDVQTIERMQDIKALENYGFKVYSQNDEDGIIEEIFNRIGVTNKIFVEFGLQDGLECNTHYLLFKEWHGLWIECDDEACKKISSKFINVIKNGQLKVLKEFITKENINDLFIRSGICGEIDLLSIDIDGNDYYVFENINAINPRVVIMEYNGKFPPSMYWKQAYNSEHIWDGSDKHGASLNALEQLANKKGYLLVGTNINGCNAFFVREDCINDLFLKPMTSEYMYNPMRVNLKHKSGHPPCNCLHNMRAGIEGVFDFYPDEKIHFVYGFSDLEENDYYKYRYMNALYAKIYIKALPENKEEIVLNYINPFPDFTFKLKLSNKGRILAESIITQAEGMISLSTEEFDIRDAGYSLDLEINKLYIPNKIFGINDFRKLGIGIRL